MKVLIVLGSPRRGGNSEILARSTAAGIEDAGGAVEFLRLNKENITPCQGCGGCEKTGSCILNDDMTLLYQKIAEADAMLLVSPVYFYGLTAQMKTFVDRCQALWCRRYLLDVKKVDSKRKGYFMATAATKGEKMFQCCMFSAKYFFDAISMSYDYEDSFLVNGVDAKGEVQKDPQYVADAYIFGVKICSE